MSKLLSKHEVLRVEKCGTGI